jgi:hypothetical protein
MIYPLNLFGLDLMLVRIMLLDGGYGVMGCALKIKGYGNVERKRFLKLFCTLDLLNFDAFREAFEFYNSDNILSFRRF